MVVVMLPNTTAALNVDAMMDTNNKSDVTSATSDYFDFPSSMTASIIGVRILLAGIIVITNVPVIYLYIKCNVARDIQNRFLVQLSVFDLLAAVWLILSLPGETAYFRLTCVTSALARAVCYMQASLGALYISGTSSSMLCVILDRFMRIKYPLRYSVIFSTKWFLIATIILQINVVSISLTILFYNTWEPYKSCYTVNLLPKTVLFFIILPYVASSIILILVLYVWMLYIGIRSSHRSYIEALPLSLEGNNLQNDAMRAIARHDFRRIRRLGIIIAMLVVSFLPVTLNNILFPWADVSDPSKKIMYKSLAEVCRTLTGINSALNPVLYHYRVGSFRNAAQKLHIKLKNRNQDSLGANICRLILGCLTGCQTSP